MEHILRLWPNMVELASDIGAPYPTVAAWKQRGRIPAAYDLDLIEAAGKRGHLLTLDDLAQARRATKVASTVPSPNTTGKDAA